MYQVFFLSLLHGCFVYQTLTACFVTISNHEPSLQGSFLSKTAFIGIRPDYQCAFYWRKE